MSNQKAYFLDLQTLLLYLGNQSCELITGLKVLGKTARGSILLKDGKIVYCLLILHDGRRITGEQAYKQIETCTEWQVDLRRAEGKDKNPSSAQIPSYPTPVPFLSMPSAPADDLWPSPLLRQKRPLDLAEVQDLELKERLSLRSVYAMVNGKRSKEEIKAQLRLSSSDIDNALIRLQMLDLIE